MMNIFERFNRLIQFDADLGVMKCEDVVNEIDDIIIFDHDTVDEIYDREDRVYDIQMHFKADDELLELIKKFLDGSGFKNRYSIYNRLVS